ncbi:MAG: hypothetical protein ACRCX8_00775 [Sarcina sp.]
MSANWDSLGHSREMSYMRDALTSGYDYEVNPAKSKFNGGSIEIKPIGSRYKCNDDFLVSSSSNNEKSVEDKKDLSTFEVILCTLVVGQSIFIGVLIAIIDMITEIN